MWKLLVGFALFAALAIFIMMKSGGDIDMSGEKHDVAAPHTESASASAASSAPAVPAALPEAASAAASAASN